MPRYVAFLRAINVGGHTVKMDHLRRLFETLDLKRVETFIASGNVIFESTVRNTRSLEKRIETHLLESLGYRVATFIRSTSEVASIAEYEPFSRYGAERAGGSLFIGFLAAEPAEQAARSLLSCATEVDDFYVLGREVYWWCRTKFSESEFSAAKLEKLLAAQTTIRNSNTIRRIASRYS